MPRRCASAASAAPTLRHRPRSRASVPAAGRKILRARNSAAAAAPGFPENAGRRVPSGRAYSRDSLLAFFSISRFLSEKGKAWSAFPFSMFRHKETKKAERLSRSAFLFPPFAAKRGEEGCWAAEPCCGRNERGKKYLGGKSGLDPCSFLMVVS